MVTFTVDGTDRTCDTVSGPAATVGRRSIRDTGDPGYARLTVILQEPPIIEVGAAITIEEAGTRHSGTVSNVALSHDSAGAAHSLTSMGPLASWGRVTIGDEPWPAETVQDRAERIAALIGQPIIVQGGREQRVVAKDVDRRPAVELLRELAESTGGWLFDFGANIYLQALDARRVTPLNVTWAQEPEGATWAQLGPEATWDEDLSGTIAPPITLHCDEVVYEPVWAQTNEIANHITIEYGPDAAESVTAADQASIDLHGRREATLTTQLADTADAITLANLVLERAAWPAWALQSVEVHWDDLDAAQRARLGAAIPGARITITQLPQPAPADSFPGVLEGWDEAWFADEDGNIHRRTTLYLSHILHSMAVPTWAAEPAGATWNDLDPALTWEEDL
jgi:hypothetical protein